MSPPADLARNLEMVRLRDEEGLTYAQIAARFGVSHQWARRIVLANRRRYHGQPAPQSITPVTALAQTVKRKKDGRYSQDALVKLLVPAIDAARGKVSSAHRDQARQLVAELIASESWATPYVTHQLSRSRLRWLASNGVGEAMVFLTKERP